MPSVVTKSDLVHAAARAGNLSKTAEIEEVVQQAPGIAGCQVVAVARAGGLVPVAFVLLQNGALLDEAAVMAHAGRKLARYKVPHRVFPIAAFPVTPGANATKIQKGKLRELAETLLHLMIPLEEEKFMIKLQRLALVALVGSAFALPVQAQAPLTFSSWVPPTHHLTIWQANWAADIEKATNGRVKFQSLPKHPSAPPGTFDAVREGLVDLSFTTASYTPARHVFPKLPELPGAGDTAEVNSVAYSRIHWKHFHKLGEYNGVKLLAVWTHGPGQMHTKKPIRTLADFKGMKIRTGGGISEDVITALGGSPFFKPAGESFELLKSGVADGIFFPLESIVSFKLDTVLEQTTIFPGGLYSSAFGFFMNQAKWDKLAKQDQDIIEKHGYEYAARSNGKSWDTADQRGLEAIKKSQIRLVTADAALQAEAQKRSAPIIEEWIKQASAKGVDAKAILAEFREELKKVAAGK